MIQQLFAIGYPLAAIHLSNDNALWLLWCLPLLAGIYAYSFHRKNRSLRHFATGALLAHINRSVSVRRQVFKAALLLTAAGAIVMGLTQPGWNPHTEKIQRKGRDVVVILDVSRSMQAQDIKPNRLDRAKLEIGELIDRLEGDRIALIAFAGTSVVKCPLTQDYGFARLTLADIGPESVSRGGTLIGDAIRKAQQEVFDQQDRDFKDIILITDGEDHESFPVEAAQKVAQDGIRIFAIGLGDETEGSRIPLDQTTAGKTFLRHEGEEVWSKMQGDALGEIALATPGGRYLPAGTSDFNLADVYTEFITTSQKKKLESTTTLRYDERFQIFLALALALLAIEAAVSERKKS